MAKHKYRRRPEASGQSFENMIDFANRQYAAGKVALIHKRPTPIKPLKTSGNRILSGVFEKKSTVDYDGVYRSHALYFEAKNTMNETNFPLSNIERHQFEHFEAAEAHGAICFILISFAMRRKVFYVPFSFIRQCQQRAAQGGRKSIAYSEFEEHCPEVMGSTRAILDYLIHVDKELKEETA